MRSRSLWAALMACLALSLAGSQPASAGGEYTVWKGRDYRPAYYPVRPRPVSVYFITDPYAYRYEPRGYYPYYDAGYWRPLCGRNINCVKAVFQSPYWKAWGYPKPWLNRHYHRVYHGRIRPWHW